MFTTSSLNDFHSCFIIFALQVELLHCGSWLIFAMVLLDLGYVVSLRLVIKLDTWDLQQPSIPLQTSIKNHDFEVTGKRNIEHNDQAFRCRRPSKNIRFWCNTIIQKMFISCHLAADVLQNIDVHHFRNSFWQVSKNNVSLQTSFEKAVSSWGLMSWACSFLVTAVETPNFHFYRTSIFVLVLLILLFIKLVSSGLGDSGVRFWGLAIPEIQ